MPILTTIIRIFVLLIVETCYLIYLLSC